MSWIDDFLAASEHITSPRLFRKWAAISTISAALERKVWFVTAGSIGYPNLYTVLVGPPGVGKTEVIYRVRDMLTELKTIHVASASVTKASLVDETAAALRHVNRPNEVPSTVLFNSLNIVSTELGVLLPAYDLAMMNMLQDLYDCKAYSESRRSKELMISIKNPHVSLLAGCTPSYLSGVLPEGAWDQGFTARTIFIYCGESVRVPLFGERPDEEEKWKQLQEGLKKISAYYGKVQFTKEAAELAQAWADTGGNPAPTHPRLIHYNTRRILQMLKLSVIASVARSPSLCIEVQDIQTAIDWLLEAEEYMPDIFKAMSGSTHAQLVEDIYHFVLTAYSKGNKTPVHASRVINFVQQRTPAHNVERVLDVMKKANMIEETLRGYKPRTRQDL